MQEMKEMQVQSLGQEDPLEEGMATHSSILAWRISWTEEPGGLQSTGLQRVRRDWAHTHTHTHTHTHLYSWLRFDFLKKDLRVSNILQANSRKRKLLSCQGGCILLQIWPKRMMENYSQKVEPIAMRTMERSINSQGTELEPDPGTIPTFRLGIWQHMSSEILELLHTSDCFLFFNGPSIFVVCLCSTMICGTPNNLGS